MKIVDNAKKYGLPPRYAVYNAVADTLTFYASYRGYNLGRLSAIRRYVYDAVLGFFLSSVDGCWKPYSAFVLVYEGRLSCAEVLSEVMKYTETETAEAETETAEAETETAEAETETAEAETETAEAETETAEAETETAEAETETETVFAGRSYRRKVSCAGSPCSAHWAVYWCAGGECYIRAYQSEKRAVKAYEHYIGIRGACVVLLWRSPRWSWGVCRHCYNSLRSEGFTDHLMKVTREARDAAFQHFGG